MKHERATVWSTMAIGLSATCVAAGLYLVGALQALDLSVYDRAVAARSMQASTNIVLVTIGDRELSSWGWPVSDGRLAELASVALKAGALGVGIDIYRDQAIAPGTLELASLLKNPNVFGISKLATDTGPAIAPPPELKTDLRYGFSDFPIDADGTVRRALLLVDGNDGVELSFALSVATHALGNASGSLEASADDPETLLFGVTPVPRLGTYTGNYVRLDNRGYQIPINYKSDILSSTSISASELLQDPIARHALKGKIALIGIISESVKDAFMTPLSQRGELVPGVAIHGAVIDQLIGYGTGAQVPVRILPLPVILGVIFTLGLFGSLAALIATSATKVLLWGPGAGLAILFASAAVIFVNLSLPSATYTIAWLGAFVAATITLTLIGIRQRQALQVIFSKYLSAGVADAIWQNRALVMSGGRPRPMRLYATVLFLDMAGATRLGGSMEPEAYLIWISRCLDHLAGVAGDRGGFIDKFTGDGLLVVFGAPVPSLTAEQQGLDARRACECALAMRDGIDALNAGNINLPPYRARIGIHSGTLLGGVLGDARRLQYTVLGDVVNTAARIEAFGKKIDPMTYENLVICLSSETAKYLSPASVTRPVGSLTHDDGNRSLDILQLLSEDNAN